MIFIGCTSGHSLRPVYVFFSPRAEGNGTRGAVLVETHTQRQIKTSSRSKENFERRNESFIFIIKYN